MPHNPTVSLVIPTCGRDSALERCLYSVARLLDPPDEVIVIENGSDAGDARALAGRHAFRYAYERRKGASRARNAGALQSSGNIIAFLDDDEVVDPHWMHSIRGAFADESVDVVTGLVLPLALETSAQIRFERRFSFNRGYEARRFEGRVDATWKLGGSGNMAVRRSTFVSLGGFDERLGAGAAGCSEDTNFFERVLEAGGVCVYNPEAVVFHEHRSDDDALRRQLHTYMRGCTVAHMLAAFERRRPASLLRFLRTAPAWYAKTSLRLLLGTSPISLRELLSEMGGCVAGVVWYLRLSSRHNP